MEELRLVFINLIGENHNGEYEYTLYYSDTPEMVWAEDYAEQVPSACSIEDLLPNTSTYKATSHAVSNTKLHLVQENSCFSIQDCIDGIINLCWVFDNKDNRYYGLPFGCTMEESEIFLKKYGFTVSELTIIDKSEKKEAEDNYIDDEGNESEPMGQFNEEEDLEKLYNGDF